VHVLRKRIVLLLLLLTLWLDLFASIVLAPSLRIGQDLCSNEQFK
jgi:hypothetical protein